jgi:hypothetical protein
MDPREALHEALDDERFPGPALLAQSMSRLDAPWPSREGRWWPLVAAIVTLALVSTLLVARYSSSISPAPGTGTCASSAVAPAQAGPLPARAAGAMAYDDATKQVVLFGGTELGAQTALNDTWTWDGHGWSRDLSNLRPPPRMEAAMAYDVAMHQVLLFGGVDADGTPYTDTWSWDGSAWHELHPATSPPPRRDAAIAYDDDLQAIVMFGGWNPVVGGAAKLNDTWTWNGVTWTRLNPATVPPKRGSAVMAYHAGTRTLVMFGGDVGNHTNETWTFDGRDWRLVTVPGSAPSARTATNLVRDDATGALVLFGGEAPTTGIFFGPHSDTWTWDGGSWTQQRPACSPPSRGAYTFAGHMTYDSALKVVVLSGGLNGQTSSVLGDTWTWDGTTWAAAPSSQ